MAKKVAAYTTQRLRDEFGLKPRKDAVPVRHWTNQYRQKCALYNVEDCETIIQRPAKPRTEKQILAAQRLAIQSKLRSRRGKASRSAAEIIGREQICFLDSETTGLHSTAEVIEIAIIDKDGAVLVNQRIRPVHAIAAEATAIHGITDADLLHEPSWLECVGRIREILTGRLCVIFNKEFDLRLMAQSSTAHQCDTQWISDLDSICAMALSAEFYGSTNRYGTISLANAAHAAGVVWNGNAHSALADALATLDVVRQMASLSNELMSKLNATP